MRNSLIHTLFVTSLVLTFLAALLGSVQAAGDPAEAGTSGEARDEADIRATALDEFRRNYRTLYRDTLEPIVLKEYPSAVTDEVDKLRHFETSDWGQSK